MKPKIYIDGKEGTTGLQIYERLGARDDIELLLIDEDKRKDIEERVAYWLDQHRPLVQRWLAMQAELRAASGIDYAMYTVASRELMDLAQSDKQGVCIP